MKKRNWFLLAAALAVGALLCWRTAATPGTVDAASFQPAVYSTILSLLPPVVAIGLALATKEVYSSLFAGIVTGALL